MQLLFAEAANLLPPLIRHASRPLIHEMAPECRNKQVDPERVNALTTGRNAEAAQALLKMKNRRPAFYNVDFWWLDELVERITFGKNYDVTVHWKCGLQTSAQMAITNRRHDPAVLADRNRNAEARR